MRTELEIDEGLLAEARRLLGASAADTVDRALAGLITEQRRLAAVEAEYRRLADGWYEPLLDGGPVRP